MKTDLNQVKNLLNQHRDLLRQKYHVENLGIFGSMVRGEVRPKSDLDMLVEFSKAPGLFKFIELEEFLSRVVGRKVDLVTKRALKPTISEDVLQDVLYV